jgi:hypothetical protein
MTCDGPIFSVPMKLRPRQPGRSDLVTRKSEGGALSDRRCVTIVIVATEMRSRRTGLCCAAINVKTRIQNVVKYAVIASPGLIMGVNSLAIMTP